MNPMVKILSVSMPRSGHHVIEMVMKGLFQSKFAYCEFYTVQDCCKKIPCAKVGERQAAGALVFMQKTHDHNLTDPIPAGIDGILVQVREPVARALSNYELDTRALGPDHSRAYLQFSLGAEAAYGNAFFRKWCRLKDGPVLVARYEELVRDPAGYFEAIFKRFSLSDSYFNKAEIIRMQGNSSGGNFQFKPREPQHSKYYDKDYFDQYAAIIAPSAAICGYEAGGAESLAQESSAIGLSYSAFTAIFAGDFARALDAFTAYLNLPDAHFCGFYHRAIILRRLGRNAEAERDLQRLLEIDDGFEAAYFSLAELQDSSNGFARAQETLRRCLARSANPMRTHERITRRFFGRRELIPDYTPPPRPMLTKDEVIAAFRYILGREPLSESVVKEHQAAGSIAALRAILIKSAEFATIYQKMKWSDPDLKQGK